MYSVLGIALLLWRKARPKTLLIWSVISLLLPIAIIGLLYLMVKLGEMSMGAEVNGSLVHRETENNGPKLQLGHEGDGALDFPNDP